MTSPGLALTRHALREAFGGRRRYGLAALALTPAALGLALRRWSEGSPDPGFVVFVLGVGLVVPLMALWIGVANLRGELREGTIVHLAAKPVPRALLLVTRAGGAALATWLLAGVGLTLVYPAAGSGDAGAIGTTWLVTGLAALAYTSLFTLFAALTDRGVLAGLAYLVGWEGVVASTGLFFRKATIAFWVRSIASNRGAASGGLFGGEITQAAATGDGVLVLLAIAAGATLAGALAFGRREFRGPEPE